MGIIPDQPLEVGDFGIVIQCHKGGHHKNMSFMKLAGTVYHRFAG